MKSRTQPLWVIGWREWISMPDLEIEAIKAKVDTGARSSALHAVNIERFRRRGRDMVRFDIHPHQRDTAGTVFAEAELVEERKVRSSTGHLELRPVVLIAVRLRGRQWTTEFTLTGRYEMGFRVLLGRQALRGRFLVDTQKSFAAGRPRPSDRSKSGRA